MPAGRGFVRMSLIGLVVAVLGLAGVHAYNFVHLDVGAFHAAAEPLLARAREINERARPEYHDLAWPELKVQDLPPTFRKPLIFPVLLFKASPARKYRVSAWAAPVVQREQRLLAAPSWWRRWRG
jgi:hypothetical protein